MEEVPWGFACWVWGPVWQFECVRDLVNGTQAPPSAADLQTWLVLPPPPHTPLDNANSNTEERECPGKFCVAPLGRGTDPPPPLSPSSPFPIICGEWQRGFPPPDFKMLGMKQGIQSGLKPINRFDPRPPTPPLEPPLPRREDWGPEAD